jgi:glycerophosphoryl diester phosphodiesterase
MKTARIAGCAALAACLLGAPAIMGQATACPPAPAPVDHRGGVEHFTENTRNAFRDGSNLGANFWERDVQFLSDNTPVVMHDDTVDRTTDGTGPVPSFTLTQWRQLRTADDQPPPTLAELINDLAVDKANSFIELKTAPADVNQWTAFVSAIKSREGKGGPRPVISSFSPAVLDQVATVNTPAGTLAGYTRALIQSVGDADPATITPHASILLKHHDAITSARLAKWTAAGLKVYAWADIANDPPSEWERLAGLKVAGYITGTPGDYIAWRNSRTC